MFECFNCLQRAVVWQADFDFEDYGIEDRKGIVHTLVCSNCGADIVYYVPSFREGTEEVAPESGGDND